MNVTTSAKIIIEVIAFFVHPYCTAYMNTLTPPPGTPPVKVLECDIHIPRYDYCEPFPLCVVLHVNG